MQRNVRLVVAYDGTDFHGWQKQPGLRTVQDTLEQSLRRVVRHQVTLLGSGRTDAGVHARGQVANFRTTTDLACNNLRRAVGGRLPKDVSLCEVRDASLDFRATSDAISKLYRYTIHNHSARPVGEFVQRYTYHCWHRLDIDRMRAGADRFLGEHDFAAFASKGNDRETTIRTVFRCDVHVHFNQVRIDVEGSGFLYNQVRNMVGTLVEVGRGRWAPERIRDILASRDRSEAGPTAPARGLCLQWVRYDLPSHPPPETPPADETDASDDACRSGDRR